MDDPQAWSDARHRGGRLQLGQRGGELSGLGVYGQRYSAAGAKAGAEFRVNTTVAKDQDDPSVAGFQDGGFVVTWTSLDQDGSGLGVYGQNFDAVGARLNVEFRVNTAVAKDQWQSAVATLSAGNSIAAWTSRDQDGSLGWRR